MSGFLPPTKILMLLVRIILLNVVMCLATSPTIGSASKSTKSCDNANKTQDYTFRFTPTETTSESGIKGSVLLTVDKENLCTETTACEAELHSKK